MGQKRLLLGSGAILLTSRDERGRERWRAEFVGQSGFHEDDSMLAALGGLLTSHAEMFAVLSPDGAETRYASILAQNDGRTVSDWPIRRDTSRSHPGPSGLIFHEHGGRYEILDADGVVIASYEKFAHAGHHHNTGHATRPGCCDAVDERGDVKLRPGKRWSDD